MPLIEQTLDGKRDKVKIAIERIKAFCPISNGYMDEPYFVAYSGGKDSDVLRILFELSGVPFDLVHNHTSVDAPETVRYVRSIPNVKISYPDVSMWQLIASKTMPPTRHSRYCCDYLKERSAKNRFLVTGVRWQEGHKRKTSRNSLELKRSTAKNSLILNADNHVHRKMFESCITKGKKILNPIVDWSDDDVWDFLKCHGCRSNPLYDCGYSRIGCIGCPMPGSKWMIFDFYKYPKYKNAYIRAFDRMLLNRVKFSDNHSWKSGSEVFDWWIRDTPKPNHNDMQLSLDM